MKKIIALIALMAATPAVAAEDMASSLLHISARTHVIGTVCGMQELVEAGEAGRYTVDSFYPKHAVQPLFNAYINMISTTPNVLAVHHEIKANICDSEEVIVQTLQNQLDYIEAFTKDHSELMGK